MLTESPSLRVHECQSCGAGLQVEAHLRTLTCPYCDSPGVVERPPTPDRPPPTFVVGFVLTGEEAAERVQSWVRSRGLFAHSGLKRASVETVRGVYLPAYLYAATSHTTYSAEIGENYTVTETYTTTDANGKTVTRTRTKTKTEWRSLAGRHACYVQDVLVSASRGLGNDELEAIEPYDLRALVRYEPGMIAGWIAEEASRGREECRELARGEGSDQVGSQIARFLPGDSQRAIRYSTRLSEEALEPVLLPVWVFAARYAEDRPPLRIVLNGQTGQIHGEVPLSWPKIAIAVVLLLAVVVALVVALSGGL